MKMKKMSRLDISPTGDVLPYSLKVNDGKNLAFGGIKKAQDAVTGDWINSIHMLRFESERIYEIKCAMVESYNSLG